MPCMKYAVLLEDEKLPC